MTCEPTYFPNGVRFGNCLEADDGSTSPYDSFDNNVVVKSSADLAGPLDSTKQYFIDGVIDMAGVEIQVPQGGLNINGFGFGISKLTCSEDGHTLFVVEDTYAGNLFVNNIEISSTGVGAKIFNIDNAQNNGAVEFINVNFGDFISFSGLTSLGDISNYRQMLASNVAWLNVQDGYTINGTMAGGITFIDSIILEIGPSAPSSVTYLQEGASFSLQGSFRTNLNAIGIASTSVFCDFQESNIVPDGGMNVNELRINPDASAFPNIPQTSTKSFYKNCRGLKNTYVGGAWTCTTEVATPTSGTTQTKLLGTTTPGDLTWMSQTDNNELTFDAIDFPVDVDVRGIISLNGSNNREFEVQVRQWDNSASSYIDVGPGFKTTTNGGPASTRAENTSFAGIATLDKDDRIEVWITNITGDGTSVTMVEGGLLIISERAP